MCLTEAGDPGISGLCNYVLKICSSDGKSNNWVLYMIDSGTYNSNNKVEGYGYITRHQIRWYTDTAEAIKKECGHVPALAFLHIPLPEYDEVWRLKTCYGEKNEELRACLQVMTMLMTIMVSYTESGCIMGVLPATIHTGMTALPTAQGLSG